MKSTERSKIEVPKIICIDCKDLSEVEEINLLLEIHKFILLKTSDNAYVPIVIINKNEN